jgi:hypothetical protein
MEKNDVILSFSDIYLITDFVFKWNSEDGYVVSTLKEHVILLHCLLLRLQSHKVEEISFSYCSVI